MFTVFYTNVGTGEQGEAAEMQTAGFLPTMTFEEKAATAALRAAQRPAFVELLRSIERISLNEPKRLVVTKLERIGRDAEDILVTVRTLHKLGVEVIVLQLGREDLMSPNGKTVLNTLIAVAELGRPAQPRAGLTPNAAATAGAGSATAPAAASNFGARETSSSIFRAA